MELCEMNVKQLEELHEQVRVALEQRHEEEREEKKKKLKDSGKLKELKDELKALEKDYEKVGGGQELVLNIPVKFTRTYSPISNISEAAEYCEVAEEDLFDEHLEATLGSSGELNRKQKAIINSALENLMDWACDDIYELFPCDEGVKEFVKRVAAFSKALEKHGLCAEDLR